MYDGTELKDSFDPHSLSWRLPDPDQSESVGADPRLDLENVVAVELADPNELIELFEPNDRTLKAEDVDSIELVEWLDAIDSSEPVIPDLF
ncbi:hypothetical protein OH720_15320 [Pseudomonas sp. WJP1]|uniref:hypothetical protein n=1 Tax=Pseudomonas sp. WJP1 TaxID=2986947 RepID=UPI002349EB75|nr:hypothetical protein [Pseudomonas sp. WJP1]WCM54631.1 hypothetical protein OH720_15320 [Pseudomonas sp. WJP1]